MHKRPSWTYWIASFALSLASASGQLKVGDSSEVVPFTVFDSDGTPDNASLLDYENKVVIVFYYTPW